jgi:hypothetical protein
MADIGRNNTRGLIDIFASAAHRLPPSLFGMCSSIIVKYSQRPHWIIDAGRNGERQYLHADICCNSVRAG